MAGSLCVLACSSEAETPPPPTSCNPETERVGTYRLTFTEESGDCGPLADELVPLAPSGTVGEGCVLDYERLSDGNCKLERALTCRREVPDPGAIGGYSVQENRTVGVTRQQAQDGSRITGTFTASVSGHTGSCTSTYAVVAVRQ